MSYYMSSPSIKQLKPLSEILPDALYQGMRPKSYIGYDLVISCEEFLAKGPMEGFKGGVLHVPMVDEDDFVIPERLVWAAAGAGHATIRDGGKVLVHCTGGLNRSNVVTTTILRLLGQERKASVEFLRAMHDDFCLCNKAFERWVTGEELPTAETSAFKTE